MTDQKITFEDLRIHLLSSADILRKSLNASENSKPVLTLLFLKRLNDVFEENAEKQMREQNLDKEEAYNNPRRHDFFIPKDVRWSVLEKATEDIGPKIISVCKKIEEANREQLGGTMTYSEFNVKEKYPDTSLRKLIAKFGEKRLRTSDLENEDVFGDAYEQLLEMFADETKKKGGQFYTPRQVVRLLVHIVEPKHDHRICDPTCGSGGMLIHSRKFVEEQLKKEGYTEDKIKEILKNMTLNGQDSNPDTVNICKMNMVIHGIPDFKIEWGDVLQNPKFVSGGQLIKYDRVLANFPFSEDWDNEGAEKDTYGRFKYGIPPAKNKADFAFILHMLRILNEKGRAGIIASQGVLFRAGPEHKIRKNLILGNTSLGLPGDIIEGIVALPVKLFFGTGVPGCVLILNRKKPESRKNKIIFIHAAQDFEEGPNRNKLREIDLQRITIAFKNFKEVDKYCHIAKIDEIKENNFNLNVSRYVDRLGPEEDVDIQETIKKLKDLELEKFKLQKKGMKDLQELGFEI